MSISKASLNKLKPIAIEGSISRKKRNSPGNKIGICFGIVNSFLPPSPEKMKQGRTPKESRYIQP